VGGVVARGGVGEGLPPSPPKAGSAGGGLSKG
jgi:hypothetical protein